MVKKRALQQNRGSTLAWVAITMVVLLILVGAILSLATFYHQKSVSGNARSQSYYTAQSGINTVVSALNADPKGTLATKLKDLPSLDDYSGDNKLQSSEYLSLGEVIFDTEASMGQCSVNLYHLGEGYYIKAVGSQGEETRVVAAELGLKTENDNPLPLWNDFIYGAGFSAKEWRNASVKGSSLYLDNQTDSETLELWANGQNSIEIDGNLYSHRGISLPSNSKGCTIGGTVITDKSFTAAGTYTVLKGLTSSSDIALGGSGVIGDSTAKSGGDIVGNAVTVSDNTAVYGSITANTVTLSGSATVVGDITADTLTLSGNVKITGNVTAKNIILKDNAEIAGNVAGHYLQLITSAPSSETKHITGTTTVYQVHIPGSILTRYDMEPIFWGDLTVQQLRTSYGTYSSESSLGYPSIFMDVILKTKIAFTTVTYTKTLSLTAPEFPEVKQPTGLPATAPSSVTVNRITDSDVSGNRVKVEMGDENDTYYEVSLSKKKVSFDITSLKGSGNVYLFVKNGTTLNLNSIAYDQSFSKTLPCFFIVGEPGSTININVSDAAGFYGYVWGRSENTVACSVEMNCDVHGGIFAQGNLAVDKGQGNDALVLTYIPLAAGSVGSGGSGGGSARDTWYVKQYYNDVPSPKEVN